MKKHWASAAGQGVQQYTVFLQVIICDGEMSYGRVHASVLIDGLATPQSFFCAMFVIEHISEPPR